MYICSIIIVFFFSIAFCPADEKGKLNSGNKQNVVYVSKSGDDAAALPGRMDKTYLTIAAAARTTENELIYVFPGIYTNGFLLNKRGDLFALPGTVIYSSTNGLMSSPEAATNTISGDGVFRGDTGTALNLFEINSTGAIFNFTADRVEMLNVSSETSYAFLIHAAKEVKIDLDSIFTPTTNVMFRYGSGDIHARIGTIFTAGGALDTENTWSALEYVSAGNTNVYNAHLRGDYLRSAVGFAHLGDNPNQVNWITYDVIEGNSYAYYVSSTSRGKNYITSKKLWSRSKARPVMIIHGSIIDWIRADKITSDGGGWMMQEAGILDFEVMEWDDPLNAVQNGIFQSGGTNTVHGGRMRAAGTCVNHLGGTGIYNSVKMYSQGGSSPIVVAAGGLTLNDCSLTASDAVASIAAASTQTVTIGGTLTLNTDPSTNIFFAGGRLIVTGGTNTAAPKIYAPQGSTYQNGTTTNFWLKDSNQSMNGGWISK